MVRNIPNFAARNIANVMDVQSFFGVTTTATAPFIALQDQQSFLLPTRVKIRGCGHWRPQKETPHLTHPASSRGLSPGATQGKSGHGVLIAGVSCGLAVRPAALTEC